MPEESDELPTIRDALEEWLGFKLPGLPGLPMPQTRKNIDKAVSQIILATAKHVKSRIDGRTSAVEARSAIRVEDLFNSADEERKARNRAKIVRDAIAEVSNTKEQTADASSEIDDDWLNLFSRMSEDKTSEELQQLCSKVLAGEVGRPGRFSLRTIQCISTLGRADAQEVADFLSFALDGTIALTDDIVPPSIALRVHMQEVGILGGTPARIGSLISQRRIPSRKHSLIVGSELGVCIQNETDVEIELNLACQPLTQVGVELMSVASRKPTPLPYIVTTARQIAQEAGTKYPDEYVSGAIRVLLVNLEPAGADGAMSYRILRDMKARP